MMQNKKTLIKISRDVQKLLEYNPCWRLSVIPTGAVGDYSEMEIGFTLLYFPWSQWSHAHAPPKAYEVLEKKFLMSSHVDCSFHIHLKPFIVVDYCLKVWKSAVTSTLFHNYSITYKYNHR